ncbi:MAG: tetratricopeptide repeat protein [Chloroflexi bacterium]|nr:tetratricopeptide repeat protein [Chloroflexota bacterium]
MPEGVSGQDGKPGQQLSRFIGREQETAAVFRSLQNPDCRLLTLVGPGGIGKTRLALHVAGLAEDHFDDGCRWIDLQPISSVDLIGHTIADAIDLTVSGDPFQQIANSLKNRHMLLVLDNFEHLLDGALLLTPLLAAAPAVKLLITSREALNLREEWIHHLEGLSYPMDHHAGDIRTYAAVELFAATAERLNPSFGLENDKEAVIRICRHVDGMPLALELAASWARTLSCAQIAAEIERGFGLLTAKARNLPERHRSIQIIFRQTCDMLTQVEYAVFKRLAVFRGGFTWEAAEHVAEASIPILSVLIDKSLLKHASGDRYQMHELVRQYAAEQLSAIPDEMQRVRERHSVFFMSFLKHWEVSIMGGGQREGIAALKADMDNVRTAWQWAVEHAAVALIEQGATALAEYGQVQSHYQEAAVSFEQAVASLGRQQPTQRLERTKLLISHYLAGFYLRIGRLSEAEQILLECEATYHRLGITPVAGFTTDPAFNLGILALIRGNYAAALQYGEQARQTSETYPHPNNRQLAYHLLAEAAIGLGDYKSAERYAQKSYALLVETGNRWFMAYTFNQLGTIARALRDYQTARQYFEASYTIREEFNDPEGMALALNHLGEIALQQQAYGDAGIFFHKSLTIYDEISDRGGSARARNGLAITAMAVRDYQAARDQLKRALEIAVEIQFVSFILTILMNIGELLARVGLMDRAATLLSLVAHQPAASHDTQLLSLGLLEQFKLERLPDTQVPELDIVVSSLLQVFPEIPAEAASVREHPYTPKFQQFSVEPLTEREQEVLHYIAEGLQNREIAQKLIVTVGTVKAHVNHIYSKLDVTNRVQAVVRARELNLLP